MTNFSSKAKPQKICFPKNSLSNWFIAHMKYFFTAFTHSPRHHSPSYNIFIACLTQQSLIFLFTHVHAAHGLIIILSHSHFYMCRWCELKLTSTLQFIIESLSFCNISSSLTCLKENEENQNAFDTRIFMRYLRKLNCLPSHSNLRKS